MARLKFYFALLVTYAAADGLPSSISVADDAPPADKYAANELLKYLKLACPQQNFTIVSPSKGADEAIIVGPGAALTLGLPKSKLAGLGDEGVYLNFFTPPFAGSIVLSGGVGSQRGTLYAAYKMLTDVVMFDFLSWDETIPPPACPSYIPHYDTTQSPAFEYRDDNQYEPTNRVDWRARVGFNGKGDVKHGGNITYATPPGFVHTSYHLLTYPEYDSNLRTPPPKLYKDHPEWFWPLNEPSTYGQLCWSNASLVDFVTKQVRKILQDRAKPSEPVIVSISQNDNGHQCQTDAEIALNTKVGSPIGSLLTAVNTIADAVGKDFPNAALDTLAYQWTRPAPTNGLKPRPNVIIRLCTIECDFAHPLTHPNNQPFQKDMSDWASLSNRTYIWNYVTNFHGYVAPFPNWHVLIQNLKYFHSHGVKGVFEEGTYMTTGGDLVQLKDYLMAKGLWDPTVDSDSLIDNFVQGYYSPKAAPYVKTYMSTLVSSIGNTSYYMHESFDVTKAPFLTPPVLLTCAIAWHNASLAVKKLPIKYTLRADAGGMPPMYVVLFRWNEVKAHAKAIGAPWPYDSDKRKQFDEFKRRYKEANMTKLDEGGNDLKWMEAQLFPSAEAQAE